MRIEGDAVGLDVTVVVRERRADRAPAPWRLELPQARADLGEQRGRAGSAVQPLHPAGGQPLPRKAPARAAVLAAVDAAAPRGGEHPPRVAWIEGHRAHQEAAGALVRAAPGGPAVAADEEALLGRRPDDVAVARVEAQPVELVGPARRRRQRGEGLAAVGAAEEVGEADRDEDVRRILRIDQDVRDRLLGQTAADLLPRLAAVVAARQVIRRAAPTGVDDLRIGRIDGDGVDVLVGHPEVAPGLAAVAAAEVEVGRGHPDLGRLRGREGDARAGRVHVHDLAGLDPVVDPLPRRTAVARAVQSRIARVVDPAPHRPGRPGIGLDPTHGPAGHVGLDVGRGQGPGAPEVVAAPDAAVVRRGVDGVRRRRVHREVVDRPEVGAFGAPLRQRGGGHGENAEQRDGEHGPAATDHGHGEPPRVCGARGILFLEADPRDDPGISPPAPSGSLARPSRLRGDPRLTQARQDCSPPRSPPTHPHQPAEGRRLASPAGSLDSSVSERLGTTRVPTSKRRAIRSNEGRIPNGEKSRARKRPPAHRYFSPVQ